MNIETIVTGPIQVNTYFVPVKVAGTLVLVIVDPGGDSDLIFDQIKKLKLNPIAIVLTHGHFDHLGAVPALKDAFPDIQIGIHKDDSFYLGKNAYEEHYSDFFAMGAGEIVRQLQEQYPELPKPDFFLEDEKEIALMPGWKVLHTPGHSAGSVCLYNQEQATLFSGDTMFLQSCGRTDLHGGDAYQMQCSLQKLLLLPPFVKVRPGHGGATSIGSEQRNYAF
ncbi:MAG: hypothetical protein BKP49_03080 [Treponema sp. CETP13]|nr:MAG: hypothetical protein BKP49_03080 [Treponema sp. CETP13]